MLCPHLFVSSFSLVLHFSLIVSQAINVFGTPTGILFFSNTFSFGQSFDLVITTIAFLAILLVPRLGLTHRWYVSFSLCFFAAFLFPLCIPLTIWHYPSCSSVRFHTPLGCFFFLGATILHATAFLDASLFPRGAIHLASWFFFLGTAIHCAFLVPRCILGIIPHGSLA